MSYLSIGGTDQRRKKERTTELVVQAIKLGLRGIDTACQPKVGPFACYNVKNIDKKHYREDLVGAALKQVFAEGIVKREDLWIQTK